MTLPNTPAPMNDPPPQAQPAGMPLAAKTGRRHPFFSSMLLLWIAPLMAVLLLEGFVRGGIWPVLDWIGARPVMFLINYGVMACFFWPFAFFRSDRVRGCLAVLFTTVLCLLGAISHYKLRYRFEPILLTDAWQINDMRGTLGHMTFDIDWQPIFATLIVGFLLLILSLVFARRVRSKRGLLWPVFAIAAFCCLLSACHFANPLVLGATDLADYARRGGTLYTAIAAEQKRQEGLRVQYDDAQISEEYEKARNFTAPDKARTPNIVFVLSEAFYDQAHLAEYLNFTEDVMPFYTELLKTCRWGDIYVPKQGGGTSETEFEVLTGLKSNYTTNPYSMGIPPLHSVAATLRDRGYTATTLHWFNGFYYNRYKNLRQMGFDSFYTLDTTTREFETVGKFVSDAEHYRSVMEALRKNDGKSFVFCITMQNHFPYTEEDFMLTRNAGTPFANKLSPETEMILRNYCYLLGESDRALRDFLTELSDFDEPTVVVFFGDHTPAFGEAMYKELGMPTKGDVAYKTPYFIWSNAENFSLRADMQAWQLGAYALNVAGICGDPFFNYVEVLRQSGKNEDERYHILSHDALVGAQHIYQQEGFQIESPHWQIGGEMKLKGFQTAEVDGAVYVLPILEDEEQAFKLAVNGQALDDWKVLDTDKVFALGCVMAGADGKRLNESPMVEFQGTQALLSATTRPEIQTLELGELDYQVIQEQRGCFVVQTTLAFEGGLNCLTMDGKRLGWQQIYGFSGAGQYYFGRTHGPVTITIGERDFAGYERTSSGVAAYLTDHDAKLIRFMPSSEKP